MSDVIAKLQQMLLIVFLYVFAYLIVNYLGQPLQSLATSGPIFELASLVFLPHGIRVLSAFLVGGFSIIPLLIASMIIQSFGDVFEPVYIILPGAVCAYLSLKLFQLAGYRIEPKAQMISQWRSLILVAFVAALVNGLGITFILMSAGWSEAEVTPLIFFFVIGDTLGAFLLFAVLAGGVRVARFFRRRSTK